jgi:hypothetical protein
MGNKPKLKPGKNAIIRRTDILLNEVNKLNNLVDYTHRLLTEYIAWKKDESKFKEHIKEIVDADEKESRELRKSSGADRSTGNSKQATNKRQEKTFKSNKSTKKSTPIKGTGESGNIGL